MDHSDRKVNEADFRLPEYQNAKVEDYEFRPDGKLVRKDRWNQAVQSIRCLVYDKRDWEISDVIDAVRKLAADVDGWETGEPDEDVIADIRMEDGSILRWARYEKESNSWLWQKTAFELAVMEWRECRNEQS